MSNFNIMQDAMMQRINIMSLSNTLFITDTTKDEIWDVYMNSFPEGTNEMFRERRAYDCNCCKSFIRRYGSMVVILQDTYEMISIWDIAPGGYYDEVCKKMSEYVKSKPIRTLCAPDSVELGQKSTFNQDFTEEWFHYFGKIDSRHVVRKGVAGTVRSQAESGYKVLKRSFLEARGDAIDTVLELLPTIYRGEEFRSNVQKFGKLYNEWLDAPSSVDQDLYFWKNSQDHKEVCRFKNSSIGSLVFNLSDGMDIESAVGRYESMVAPQNYKRTKAVVTPSMIKKAQFEVQKLGLSDALSRRFAVAEDLTINNVLFANRETQVAMDPFGDLIAEAEAKSKANGRNRTAAKEIDINEFLQNILPKATDIELLVSNRLSKNFMSLVAPVHAGSGRLFPWDNNFSWAYKGDVTDSIKERVRAKGGQVDGAMNVRLGWWNYDDLDLHIDLPTDLTIYHSNRKDFLSGCKLDVDMNVPNKESREAVENVTWPMLSGIAEGKYTIKVNQYSRRENIDTGCAVELEFDGVTWSFETKQAMIGMTQVATFEYSKKKGVHNVSGMVRGSASQEMWGVQSETYVKVNMVLNSPNFWDGQTKGNRHLFFILESCKSPEGVRGFFNEFLRPELYDNRKVFELLGSKMMTQYSDDQLSGLGFSTSIKECVEVVVDGRKYLVSFK